MGTATWRIPLKCIFIDVLRRGLRDISEDEVEGLRQRRALMLCAWTHVSVAIPVGRSWGTLCSSDWSRRAGWCGRRSTGRLHHHLALPDPNGLIQTVIQAVGGRRVVSYPHLCVGVVSGFSPDNVCSQLPSCPLAGPLGAGGDLGKLAPVGGPQVHLRASTVEQQEIHAGRAAFTHSCADRREGLRRLHVGRTPTSLTHHLQFPLQGKRLISCNLVSDLLIELSFGFRSVPCWHKVKMDGRFSHVHRLDLNHFE